MSFWNLPQNKISGFSLYGSQPYCLTSYWVNNNWPPPGTKFIPATYKDVNNGCKFSLKEKCYDSMVKYTMDNVNINDIPLMKRNNKNLSKYASLQ